MMVISLFALLATLGVMQTSFLDSTIVHTEINKLTAACSYLRQKAITTNTECVLRFDPEKNEYYAHGIHEVLSQGICFGFIPGVLGPPGCPSHTIEKAITFPGYEIHFYPTGIVSSGTVYIADNNKRYLFALSNAVSQFSYLRLYRYDGKWKLIDA